MVSLLEPKRAYNVSIGLSRMRTDNMALKAAILAMDDQELTLDKINSLLNFVPTPEEQELVKAYDGDPKLLEMAERFFYAMRYIDNLGERLELWSFQISFPLIVQESNEKINILKTTYTTVKQNESFKFILCYILAVGNYMNGGTRKGQAYGFKLGLLEQLESTKTTNNNLSKKKDNLLYYIVSMLEQNEDYSKKAFAFLDEFNILNDALTVDIDQLTSEVKMIGSNLDKIWTKLDDATHDNIKTTMKNDGDDNKMSGDNNNNIITKQDSGMLTYTPSAQDEQNAVDKAEDESLDLFSSVMGDFYSEAFPQYESISSDMTDIVSKCSELGRFFGEKDDTKLDFLNIIIQFKDDVQRIKTQMNDEKEQEIRDRKQKEKQELQEKEKQEKKKSKKRSKSPKSSDNDKSSGSSRKSGKARDLYDKIKGKNKKKKKKKKKRSKSPDHSGNELNTIDDPIHTKSPSRITRLPSEARGRGMTFSDKVLNDITIDSVKQRQDTQHLRRSTRHFKKKSMMEIYLEAQKSNHKPSKSGEHSLPPISDLNEDNNNDSNGSSLNVDDSKESYTSRSGSTIIHKNGKKRHSEKTSGISERRSRKVPPPPEKPTARQSRPRPKKLTLTISTEVDDVSAGSASSNSSTPGSFSKRKSAGLSGISAMMSGLTTPQPKKGHERRSSRWKIEEEDTSQVTISATMSGMSGGNGNRRRRAPPKRRSYRV